MAAMLGFLVGNIDEGGTVADGSQGQPLEAEVNARITRGGNPVSERVRS